MTYKDYLLSPEWHLLRKQRLAMDNYECVLCGTSADQVHHRRYPETLGDETVNDLVSLCFECHRDFHNANSCILRLPKPTPPTEKMHHILDEMISAGQVGDEDREVALYLEYVNNRRAQMIGLKCQA